MTQSELEQFRAQSKQEYKKLLNVLALVMRASSPLSTTEVGERERLSMAQGLSNKFIEHAVTILHLSHGTNLNLPSFKFSFVDFASIDVLTRASLEAFLTFHYVFYVPQTKEEEDYRYWTYKAAAIVERQDFPTVTEEFEQNRAEDGEEFTQLREKLKSNAVFQSLTEKQKKRILRGEWRLKSWREVAIDAGLSEMLASHVYRILSGRAHSSFLSVLQSVETQKTKNQEEDIIISMSIMNPVIANMVREYCGLFPKAQEVLSKDSEGSGIVDWWIQIDRSLNEFTKVD